MAAGDITITVDAASPVSYQVDKLQAPDKNTVMQLQSSQQVAAGGNIVVNSSDPLSQIIVTPLPAALTSTTQVPQDLGDGANP